jgi:Fic family protein
MYTCAPTALIEPMMESLFNFIANSTLSAASKAAIAYYYINYIKPFADYSDEIAVLIAKAILAHEALGEVGVLLPLESLLDENQEEIARLFTEVQKTCDTTYFLNFALKQMERKCDDLLDEIAQLKANAMRRDFYRPEEKKQETTSYVVEQPSLFDMSNEEPEPRPEPRPAPVVKEEVKPVEQPKVEPKPEPIIEAKKEEPAIKVNEEPEVQAEQIAVSYIPPAIDEKQALRLEQHLLELDPSLRKHEAHFYARHCTLGKSYTIAQYKRMIGCVYETARTAMDHLVELGYYRKDSSNKKFIYTPIPRK